MPSTQRENAEKIGRESLDCSFLLTHLIRQDKGRSDDKSKDILEKILDIYSTDPKPKLEAHKTGWYGTNSGTHIFNPITKTFDGIIQNKAICFTESTQAGLKTHRDVYKAKYGLSFIRDFLFVNGANPCLNIRESLLKSIVNYPGKTYNLHIFNFIPEELLPFVNIMNSYFDATHEREWRVAHDLEFNWNDVFFVFCPEQDFGIFSKVQTNSKPCLFDLAWLDKT